MSKEYFYTSPYYWYHSYASYFATISQQKLLKYNSIRDITFWNVVVPLLNCDGHRYGRGSWDQGPDYRSSSYGTWDSTKTPGLNYSLKRKNSRRQKFSHRYTKFLVGQGTNLYADCVLTRNPFCFLIFLELLHNVCQLLNCCYLIIVHSSGLGNRPRLRLVVEA